MTAWLGVASAEHVARGVSLGIAQIGHGKRPGLARMRAGDTLVYYSPVVHLGDAQRLQAFTALGVLDDDDVWQADEGSFRPFRRRATYERARPVALAAVRDRLDLTSGASWGHQLRRGVVPITAHDASVLAAAMLGT